VPAGTRAGNGKTQSHPARQLKTLRFELNREEPTKVKLFRIAVLVLLSSLAAYAQQAIDLETIGAYPGTAVATGNGVAGAGVQRVTIASDNTAFSVNAVESGNWSVRLQDGSGNSISSTTGALNVNCTGCSAASTVSLVPQATGGLTLTHTVLAATTNATSTKASAGQLYHACVNNNTSYPIFLKLYNKASAPTVGTDTPVHVLEAQADVPICMQTEEGFAFATGIAWAATKGITDADTTAVALSDGTVELAFK
jgi:hypothetical protein